MQSEDAGIHAGAQRKGLASYLEVLGLSVLTQSTWPAFARHRPTNVSCCKLSASDML